MSGKMDTEKARFVKNKGHIYEEQYAKEHGGEIIPGTSKVDIVIDNKNYQLKYGSRYQWCLYSNSEKINKIPIVSDTIKKLLKNIPETKTLYEQNRNSIIEKEQILMRDLKDKLQKKNDLRKFLNYLLYNNKDINHVFKFEDKEIITEKSFLLNELVNCDVVNSRGDRKVILKNKNNIIEIEIRRKKKKNKDKITPSLLLVTTSKNSRNNI